MIVADKLYNHEPDKYKCPFCAMVNGKETKFNKQEQIVFHNKYTIAFVSPKWWANNPGHIIVIPKKHVENIYDISDELLSEVYKTSKKMAIKIKKTYKCDGTSTRQHNEPGGGQDVWHFHVHVYPRYKSDKLYQNHDKKRFVTLKEIQPYIEKLKKS